MSVPTRPHESIMLRSAFILKWRFLLGSLCVLVGSLSHSLTYAQSASGNRLSYLDEFLDPYYVDQQFPKLTTPQWVGEPGVDAVVVLAIDDMRDTQKYEAYLRPILERLKQIDGRAPVSIMTNRIDPQDPRLQQWLKEGLSIDVHTYDHPCPCLQKGDFAAARDTYEKCVDLLHQIPGNQPVAFRMPCCDSLNTPSPRFWAEIMHSKTGQGHYLQIDSSVFQVFTPQDRSLPKSIVLNEQGESRFRRYIPFPSFVNTIENYPYPYVIGGMSWQFPCMVPSDWEAQYVQQPNNPQTVTDMKLALDATVLKQGVFNLVFHPHGWIRNDQVVELIEYAHTTYGNRVKFLNFAEAAQRLNRHLLADHPLRKPNGDRNGVRLLDLNADGYLDVVIANETTRRTRIWHPTQLQWLEVAFPKTDVTWDLSNARFGLINQQVVMLARTGKGFHGWRFSADHWSEFPALAVGIPDSLTEQLGEQASRDLGIRFRDLDQDGHCELLVSNPAMQAAFQWNEREAQWQRRSNPWPSDTWLVDSQGRDSGLRFVDLNQDGRDDVLFSNENRYCVALAKDGAWAEISAGKRDQDSAPPALVHSGTNQGGWFHSQSLWLQNENTHRLPDGVARMSFRELLALAPAESTAVVSKQQPERIEVGVAQVDITPTEPVRLAGYASRSQPADGTLQKLWAKAIVLGGDEPKVLVTIESCGVSSGFANSIAQELQIPPAHFCLTVTHTHTAPWAMDYAPFLTATEIPDEHRAARVRYTNHLRKQIIAVVQQALANRQSGEVWLGRGQVGFAANRRVLKEGRWTGFGVQPDGPVDHELSVLGLKSSDGRWLAVLTNYACHCTTLGGDTNQVCGDWAGYAQADIQAKLPATVSLITIGCGADANPEPRGKLEHCKQHGAELARETLRVLNESMKPISAALECRESTLQLPLDTLPTREAWQSQSQQRGQVGRHARHFLEQLQRGEPLPQHVSYPISTWTFGEDLAMVFLAGEVVVDYAIRLKQEFRAERLWITSYADGVPCYIPSKRVLREGGYEADYSMIYYGQPARLAAESEDLIIDGVQKLLPAKYYSDEKQREFPPAQAPDQALQSFRVRPGYRIELVAAEPLVCDPVAFDWDAQGRLWVVEMRDYPNGLDGRGQPGGRVKLLTDTNGDGKYDQARLFLDDLPFPTGIKSWRNGVLITAAPHLIYAEDRDGDGVADHREVRYTGFAEGNQQHRVNGLRWGLDNWLYVGNGDSGGRIVAAPGESESRGVDLRGHDLRIRPDQGHLEVQSGQTQFGRSRDDWGNWFGGNNSNPVWHYVLQDHYLKRNPQLRPPGLRRNIAEQAGPAPVFPSSTTLARFNDFNMVNRFTSACSPMIYRDDRLGLDVQDNLFVCEPVHNLVHRQIVQPDNYSFRSFRPQDERETEFLSSTDNWFRPVMVRTGPDGGLWIADMYRFVIEHPEWIPATWQRKLDLRAGTDRGRIYRVVPDDRKQIAIPNIASEPPSRWVAQLNDTNGFNRDLAQQLLIWNDCRDMADALRTLVREAAKPRSRLQALCTLDGLDCLTDNDLHHAMQDEHPGVRRHGIRLAEDRLKSVELRGRVIQACRDEDPQVRLQAFYSLGEVSTADAAKALGEALAREHDPYARAAALSSVKAERLTQVVLPFVSGQSKPDDELLETLIRMALTQNDMATIQQLAEAGLNSQPDFQSRLRLVGVLSELARRSQARSLEAFVGKSLAEQIRQLVANAGAWAQDSTTPLDQRIAALRVITDPLFSQPEHASLLVGLLTPQTPKPLQDVALRQLAARRDSDIGTALIDLWPQLSPALKLEVADLLLARIAWTRELLERLQAGTLAVTDLDATRRQRLLDHADKDIRTLANQIIRTTPPSSVQTRLAQVTREPSDAEAGRQVFVSKCSSCHRLDGTGHAVGPDLTTLTDRSAGALLAAILDPNRAIESKYLQYNVLLDDGRLLNGVIADESSTYLTLLSQNGKQHQILRTDIDRFQASGKSLMPEGLGNDLTDAELASLLAYLARHKTSPKPFAGNQPQIAPMRDDGSIRALAIHAEIYGPSLVFEPHYRNLGYWQSTQDHAIWTLNVPHAGKYRVALDYACPPEHAGKRFSISVGDARLTGRVESTGSWDHYRNLNVGTLELPQGECRMRMASDSPITRPMLDLRGIRLVPLSE